MRVDFNKPYYTGKELQYIENAMKNDKISGDGVYSNLVAKFIEQKFGTGKALFVTSGSAALDMAALLLDLSQGDEVILPSYTFVSTANAFVIRGAMPVFVDIEEDTLNIDIHKIEEKITERTKAIFVVHYAGISCDMDKLMELAEKYNLKVVEDAAQAVNSMYKDKYLGTIGHIGCFSFHETKNYSSGEGGAILINDKSLIERAEIIREKGTNRSKFFRGEVDKYSWVDIGSSYLGSELLSAFLYAQLEELIIINEKRKDIFNYYYKELYELSSKNYMRLPFIPDFASPNYHMFYIILSTPEVRDSLMNYLKTKEIGAVFHYIPLHTSIMGEKFGYKKGDLPITENHSSCLLRLPFFANLSIKEQGYVIDTIKEFFSKCN